MDRMDRLPRLEVDGDPARARTLPAAIHRDPEWAKALVDRVLARSWHAVAWGPEFPAPGRAIPRTLLAGSLDEPLLLSRDVAGATHVLSNTCTHRGNLLVDAACSSDALRCGYHGRRFSADGICQSAPGFEGAPNFPSASDNLFHLPSGSFGPLHFASVAPAGSFDAFIAPARRFLGWAETERFAFDAGTSRDYVFDAPWTLYVENYLEGLHVPFVHPSLARELDPRAYRVEPVEDAVVQIGEATTTAAAALSLPPALRADRAHPDTARSIAAYYLWLFPTTMLNLYPWGLSVNLVEPIGAARTRVRFLSFVGDASRRSVGAGADLDRVEREDEAVVVRTARGVRSRFYDRGRLAPGHEAGVLHFHRLLARYWNEMDGR